MNEGPGVDHLLLFTATTTTELVRDWFFHHGPRPSSTARAGDSPAGRVPSSSKAAATCQSWCWVTGRRAVEIGAEVSIIL